MATPSFEQAYNTLYKGWGRAEAQADYNAGGWSNKAGAEMFTGGGGGGGGGGIVNTPNVVEQAKQLRQFQIESNQPAIASAQAQIPETQRAYDTKAQTLGGQVDPLKQRYQQVLQQIQEGRARTVKTAEIATGREYGKRGIPLSSGAYDVALREATVPIEQQFGEISSEASFGFEDLIRQLQGQIAGVPTEKEAAVRQIQNAIAQMQSGDPAQAIQGALSLSQISEQSRQFDVSAQQKQKELEQQMRIAEMSQQPSSPYATLGEGSTLFNLLTGHPVYTAPKTYKPTGGGGGNDPLGLGF